MPANQGVILYDRKRAFDGYTLVAPGDADDVYLIDMEGNIVHTWKVHGVHGQYLLENGNLIYDTTRTSHRFPRGIREVDWHGEEVWRYPCLSHHDFHRLAGGNTLILAHETIYNPAVYDGIEPKNSIIFEVTPNKEIIWLWHSDRHIEELQRLAGIGFPRPEQDWTHTNTVQELPDTPLGRRDRRFRAGNVLFSHRNLDTIGVIDKQTQEIVWAWGPGELDYQHHSQMLPGGNILVFDNGPHRGYSRVLEIEPISGEVVWQYIADPPEEFFAPYLSGQQRLPNGNTFICSGGSEDGRLFEVTSDGEVVWDFRNPFAEQAKGKVKIYRAYRYEKTFVEGLIGARG
jgi:hypothetical protein